MLDPRIGMLASGSFYAYINGYGSDPYMGSLEEVEVELGLRKATMGLCRAHVEDSPAIPKSPRYDVTLRFQYPAWDEGDGILYDNIEASSKSEANRIARRMADRDGHLHSGKGRVTFTAIEQTLNYSF